jgi:hypothetical protein
LPSNFPYLARAFLSPAFGMPHAPARRFTCESGVENVVARMPATGEMSG